MQGPGRYLRAFNGRRGVFRPYGWNHRQSNVPVRLLKLPLEIKADLWSVPTPIRGFLRIASRTYLALRPGRTLFSVLPLLSGTHVITGC
jgi:hypothetical protein